MKTGSMKPTIGIDYPQEGEKVRQGVYTVRISAEPHALVEISIDQGDWQQCRTALGYWWFDWFPHEKRACNLVARSRIGKGRWKKSEARNCQIII